MLLLLRVASSFEDVFRMTWRVLLVEECIGSIHENKIKMWDVNYKNYFMDDRTEGAKTETIRKYKISQNLLSGDFYSFLFFNVM